MFESLFMKEAEAPDAKSRAKVAELKHAYAMHEVKQARQAQLDAFHTYILHEGCRLFAFSFAGCG